MRLLFAISVPCAAAALFTVIYSIAELRTERSETRAIVRRQQARLNQYEETLRSLQELLESSKSSASAPLLARSVPVVSPPSAPQSPDSKAASRPFDELDNEAPEPVLGNAVTKKTAEIRDALEARFGQEKTDRNWSALAAAGIRDKMGTQLPQDSRLLALECHESMCRIETAHHDIASYRRFIMSALASHGLAWDGQTMSALLRTETSGEVVTVAYLTRPGYVPPYAERTIP